ncbi:hypothetical protein MMC10_009509 [Thelotrema lepadinum]|nr:hypothetical protein [Thelotrema lepadinum]
MIQVFDSGEWRDFRGIPRDSQRLLQNHQSGNKASKWALHEQETKVRFLKKYEYEIRLSMARDLSEELVRQRDKCIAANSQDDHETPLVRTIIPDPVSKVGDYLLIKPIGGQLNQQTYTAMNCLTCEIVSLAKFRVTSEDEKDALRLLQWLYGAGKQDDEVSLVYKAALSTFREFDFASAPRDTRLALFFGPLVGLSRIHPEKIFVGEAALDRDNLIITKFSPEPEAVLGYLPGPKKVTESRSHKREVRLLAALDVLGWALTIVTIISLEFGYEWNCSAEDSLKDHAENHPEDRALAYCLITVLKHEWGIRNRKDPDNSARAGVLINHQCWKGLGRWHAIRDRLFT